MAEHGPFKNKENARKFATKMRKKGFNATLYQAKGTTPRKQWKVSVTRN
ncbi:MAG: SPOR domain-containing protein [Promethearchaeota archaeon]